MEGDFAEYFVNWTKIKIRIQITKRIVYFREGEIWWASLGANIGHEQDGKNENFERPILVLKKFNQYILWAIPLTSQCKQGHPYYFPYQLGDKIYGAVLSQLRLISSKRLLRKVSVLPVKDFDSIRESIKDMI